MNAPLRRPKRDLGTVLVVDDDDDIRATIKDILEGQGFDVVTAANGREALDVLAQGDVPVLILLDLLMPEMDGWTFRRLQQQQPRLAGIPVAVFSAHSGEDARSASLYAAATIRKPLHPDGVRSLLEQLSACERAN